MTGFDTELNGGTETLDVLTDDRPMLADETGTSEGLELHSG